MVSALPGLNLQLVLPTMVYEPIAPAGVGLDMGIEACRDSFGARERHASGSREAWHPRSRKIGSPRCPRFNALDTRLASLTGRQTQWFIVFGTERR